MSSKTKILLLLMVLMLPYMAIMVPTLMRYQKGGVPTWIPLVGGFYMLFTIVTVTLFSQRLARRSKPDPCHRILTLMLELAIVEWY
jgi:hypothetical protein